ncbi:MAG: diacylglycerol kinase [bacterium]|nr:diacylglycerol kinase [bacterium]
MKRPNLVKSLNHAFMGILYALKTERNMQLHTAVAVIVLLGSFFLNITRLELIALWFAVCLVLLAEMVNTSIENVIDLISDSYHPLAEIAKDVAAGAVLLASVNALIIAYLTLYTHLETFLNTSVIARAREIPEHVSFVSLLVVIIITVSIKAIFKKGTPFRGGMPSGHAAVAFSIWTATIFLSDNTFMVILVFILAFIVAQSRVNFKIHSFWEVLSGSLIGVFLTGLIFRLIK